MAKLDRLDRETLFLAREGITTMEQLSSRRGAAEGKMEPLTTQRKELWKEYRQFTRRGDQPAADEIRGKIRQLSQRIRTLKKEIVLCDNISLRSGRIKEGLEQLLTQQNAERREKTQDDLSRQHSRRNYEKGPLL